MSNFKIVFSQPWLLLTLIPAIGLILFPFLRLPKGRRNTKSRITALILRLASMVLLVLILAGLYFVFNTVKTSIIILADWSGSTETVRGQMQDYITEIEKKASWRTDIGVVLFADDCVYEVKMGDKLKDTDFKSLPKANATNIEEAMNYAAEKLPFETAKRLIVLTDGHQTEGDAESAAMEISKKKIRVDAVNFDSTTSSEMQISDVTMPKGTFSDTEFDAAVTVESNIKGQGILSIYDGDSLAGKLEINVLAGENKYLFSGLTASSGQHTFSVKLQADDDTTDVNNCVYSYLNVSGKANILLVEGKKGDGNLITPLLETQYDVSVVSQNDVPASIDTLRKYDSVILMDVSTSELSSGFSSLLDRYISKYGGGVLTTGGSNTYVYGNMATTEFEKFLPVNLFVDDAESKETIALVLVIDSSSSMVGNPFRMAQQGALNSVGMLKKNDFVSVLSFATNTEVVCPMTSMENRDNIINSISEMTTKRGTNLYDATVEAYNQLKNMKTDLRHVMILSDGRPNDYGFDKVIADMNADGITTSTIAVGDNVDLNLMEELANIGGGRFYSVNYAEDLPSIMLSETEVSRADYITEGDFTPSVMNYTDLLKGVTAMPSLGGYVGTSMKEGATCVLYTDEDKPILSEWKYGSGTVASFTSDLSGVWSSGFISSASGQKLIMNTVKSILTQGHVESSMYVNAEQSGSEAKITASLFSAIKNQGMKATIKEPDGNEYTLNMKDLDNGDFECSVTLTDAGVYNIKVDHYSSIGKLVESVDSAAVLSYEKEYDFFADYDSNAVRRACVITGGDVTADVEKLFDIDSDTTVVEYDPIIILAALASAFIMTDITIRKLKWKDIIEFIARIKGKE